MHTATEAMKNGEKARFVIISADSDYAPLVKYLLNLPKNQNNKQFTVSVEVWAWGSTMMDDYKNDLTENGVDVVDLELYRFQVGFVKAESLIFPFGVRFQANENTLQLYNKLSHYTVVQHLIDGSLKDARGESVRQFDTADFKIRWFAKNNYFIIWFLTNQCREKFMNWLKNNNNDSLAVVLNQLHHEVQDYQAIEQSEKTDHEKLEEAARQLDEDDDDFVKFQN